MTENNDSGFYVILFLLVFCSLIFCAITRENFTSNPTPTKATSTAPVISLRCRDGLFFIENSVSGESQPLMDFDARGIERQVPCTEAYEVQKRRRQMGLMK